MRRKPVAIIAGVLAWLMLCGTALAAVEIDDGSSSVYANGHAITIKSDADASDPERTVVTAGEGVDVDSSKNIKGYTIYGGWKNADNTGDTSVTIVSGTVGDVYGGSENGDIEGNTNVTIKGGTVGDVYGGGKNGDIEDDLSTPDIEEGNTNVTISGGSVGDVHGGGHAEAVNRTETANVEGDTSIVIKGGTTGNIYGGGDADSTAVLGTANAQANVDGNTSVKINGGTVEGSVYGGGNADSTAALGAANAEATVEGNTSVVVNGGTTGDIYGGGNADSAALFGAANADATVEGDTSVAVTKKSKVGSVYGGGDNGDVGGNTDVTVNNSEVAGSVYGGSRDGDVDGSASVKINNGSSVTGNVYGGGGEGSLLDPSNIGGDTNVAINNSTVTGNVYGGGLFSNIQGAGGTAVTVNNSAAGNVFGGSVIGNAAQTAITMKGDDAVVNAIFAGSHLIGSVGSSTIVINGGTLSSGNVYGWGGWIWTDWDLTPVDSVIIKVNQFAARDYTFYLPEGTVANSAIRRAGVLRWDKVQQAGAGNFLIPYQLTQPEARPKTVIFEYYYNGHLVHRSDPQEVDVEAGLNETVYAPFWNGDSIYIVPGVSPVTLNYGSDGEIIIEIIVTRKSRSRDDDEDNIPLVPGTEGADDIPLGVPRTDNTSSASLLLTILAFACLAMIAALRKANEE